MSENKHTAGLWLVIRPRHPRAKRPDDRLIVTDDRKHIAEVFAYQNRENPHGSSEANAKLIAESPETAAERDRLKAVNAELLQTIQNALVSLAIVNTPVREGLLDVATNAELMNIMADSFRAAIAKAIS